MYSDNTFNINLPLHQEYNDYTFLIGRIFDTLEIVEDRSQLDILNDLNKIQNDARLLQKGTENINLESQKNNYKDIRCSLCNKSIDEVKEMIFTYGFSFCNECIKKRKFITEEEE